MNGGDNSAPCVKFHMSDDHHCHSLITIRTTNNAMIVHCTYISPAVLKRFDDSYSRYLSQIWPVRLSAVASLLALV